MALPARAPGRPQRPRKPPRQLYPTNAERSYRRDLMAMLAVMRGLVTDRIDPLITAAGDSAVIHETLDAIRRALSSIRIDYGRRVPDAVMSRAAQRAAQAVDAFNGQQITKQVKSALGPNVVVKPISASADIEQFVRDNVVRIKSIPERHFDEIEEIIVEHFQDGKRASAIADRLEDRFGVARSRAEFIAADQVGKLNGGLTQKRHEALGLSRYRWRNSRDERVRGNPSGKYPHAKYSHWSREGQIFAYAKPPEDGNPGKPPRCRCYGEPVFEDILPSNFAVDQAPAPEANSPEAFRSGVYRSARAARTQAIFQRQPSSFGRPSAQPLRPMFGVTTPPPPKPMRDAVIRYRRQSFVLDERQRDALQNWRWLSGDRASARAARLASTYEERRDWMIWDWVNGSRRRVSVSMRQAAIDEFRLNGVVWNEPRPGRPHGERLYDSRTLATMRGDLRRMHADTQADFAQRGIATVRLYRGKSVRETDPAAISAWSTSPSVARGFADKIEARGEGATVDSREFPVGQILTWHGAPGWTDGVFGDQHEYLVLQ